MHFELVCQNLSDCQSFSWAEALLAAKFSFALSSRAEHTVDYSWMGCLQVHAILKQILVCNIGLWLWICVQTFGLDRFRLTSSEYLFESTWHSYLSTMVSGPLMVIANSLSVLRSWYLGVLQPNTITLGLVAPRYRIASANSYLWIFVNIISVGCS